MRPNASVGERVLDFLESVGRPQEAELYLRLFRSLKPGRFAAVLPTPSVIRDSIGTLSEQLAFLRGLGLAPSLLLGAFPGFTSDLIDDVFDTLESAGVPAVRVSHQGESVAADVLFALEAGELPVFVLESPDDGVLSGLLSALQPRKLVFLRGAGGVGPHGGGRLELSPGHMVLTHRSGISVVNLRSDLDALRGAKLLSDDDDEMLVRISGLLSGLRQVGATTTTASVAAPVSLVRELFTVRGEGTLVKFGSVISRRAGFDDAGRAAVLQVLEQSFGRTVKPEFFSRPVQRIYLEGTQRGLAVLEAFGDECYLSKFAVLPVARGEGVGQDLWWEMVKDTPALFWRSRVENSINTWYQSVSDGMHRGPIWQVFWRGVATSRIPALIADADSRPDDFEDGRL